ncbi:MAG: hypothetical protein D6705_16375 [Deltaproteobacteria bacterium]|nr:MAG: hypothetical protein D6705_16375 [Deltaproteobacteria bacterium]
MEDDSRVWDAGLVLDGLLEAALERWGIEGEARARLHRYAEMLSRQLRVRRLSGARDAAEIVAHVEEGLAAAELGRALAGSGTWVDVGSGGGLPGLVVAATWPGRVVLVEPRGRRADFLELASLRMGVEVEVLRGRLEPRGWVGEAEGLAEQEIAVASARAVFAPEEWLARVRNMRNIEWCSVHTRPGWTPGPAWVSGGWREVSAWRVEFVRRDPAAT